jgi:hypothetical protein
MKPHEIEDPKLQELARQLGVRAAARLDVERMAQAVLAGLRRPARKRTWLVWTQVAWVRAAAMVVLLLGTGIVLQPRPWLQRAIPLHGTWDEPAAGTVQDLSADQLTRVLDELDQPVDVTVPASEDAGLEDLSEPQLRALLKSLEG